MRQYKNPSAEVLRSLQLRPLMNRASLRNNVAAVFRDVEVNGDEAVRRYTRQFDGVVIDELQVVSTESVINNEVKSAIDLASGAIMKFHKNQTMTEIEVETYPGVMCWREQRPIRRIGLYVPGGSAPLVSTAMMLGIPAKVAGCSEIVLCTPPGKDGVIAPEILYVAKKLGINEVYRIGGAQAIAAMSVGTETIRPVDKLFGPGNQYVMAAKQYAYELGVGVDMIAGPSEVMVIADGAANPSFVAADLLSQAEHGEDSQVVLLTCDERLAEKVEIEINRQLTDLSRSAIAKKALENSFYVVFESMDECIKFANQYAPEHLILNTEEASKLTRGIMSAGSVFIGAYSPESAGDYASGTNHTLPTNGWARSASGLSVDDYVKKVQFQQLSKRGLQVVAPAITTLAQAEGLDAHARAITIRMTD